jgi:phosphohistidine phosphatase
MAISKQRELYILRHAKSDWGSDAKSDFDRPLAKRGKKDAPSMGKWLAKQNLKIDFIVSSPAERAKQTIYAVVKELGISKKEIHYNEKIYMASLETLLQVLEESPKKAKKVMLVGHNPGLDDLLQYLVKDPPLTESGKLLTTACLAQITLPEDWTQLQRHCGKLVNLTRPRDID